MTLYQVMNKILVEGVYFLKIDTVILKNFYEENQNNMYYPHIIQFKGNVLSDDIDVNHIIELFVNKGYDLNKIMTLY